MRYSSSPLFSPEPNFIHACGSFLQKDFADFSQLIGISSLGVSDQEIAKLGVIYWFCIELGICLQDNQRKIFGAGIVSSIEEIEWCMSPNQNFNLFEFSKMLKSQFEYHELQNNYFVAPSFKEMQKLFVEFSRTISSPPEIKLKIF